MPGGVGQHLQFRPELELNPHIRLTPTLRLDCRNRAEWRWNEGEDPTSHRRRHRLQLTLSLPGRLQPATSAFVSNEWLIDLHGHGWTENRLVPMGLTFRLSATTDLDLFFMRMSSHGNGGWTSEHVVGTHLRYRWQ